MHNRYTNHKNNENNVFTRFSDRPAKTVHHNESHRADIIRHDDSHTKPVCHEVAKPVLHDVPGAELDSPFINVKRTDKSSRNPYRRKRPW